MPTPTKYFLYARKSTDDTERQVYSIEHQLTELRQLAVRKNLQIVDELTERRTAKVPGRPVFNDMLKRIKKGEASGILAWHPDRLARNAADGASIMQLIDEAAITNLEFSVFWFEPSPQGNLMLSIAFGMSKYYTDSLSQSVKRAVRQRVHAGYWPHKTPPGYQFDRQSRTVILDPIRAPLVRKCFELYATGEFTLQSLRDIMTSLGLLSRPTKKYSDQPLPRATYHSMLHNPFYVGLVTHAGERFEGKHEPLVSTHVFDACQLVLGQRGNFHHPNLKPFLYRGMFRCGECDCAITLETQKGHSYLRCTKSRGECSQAYIRQEDLAKQISRLLKQIALPQKDIDGLLADALHAQEREVSTIQEKFKHIRGKIDAFDLKLNRLIAVYVEGALPLSQFNLQKENLLKNKRAWNEKLTFIQNHRKTPLEPMIFFIRGLTEARNIIEGNDDTQKRDLLQKAASNLKLTNGRLTWTPRGPWKYVAGLGVLTRCAARVANASGTANAFCPEVLPSPCAARWSLSSLQGFFEGAVETRLVA